MIQAFILRVLFENYTMCNRSLEVCEVQSVDQVLDQQLTTPEGEPEEKVAKDETILGALKELEAATKYLCQFDTEDSINQMCKKFENEVYRLRTQEK
jgi:hypothetical protein